MIQQKNLIFVDYALQKLKNQINNLTEQKQKAYLKPEEADIIKQIEDY